MNRKGILLLFLTAASLLMALESERERFASLTASDELAGAFANVVGRVRAAGRGLTATSAEQIVRTSRVRSGGYVKIDPVGAKGNGPTPKADRGLKVYSQIVEGWRVSVAGPVQTDVRAGSFVSASFGIATIVLVLMLFHVIAPNLRRTTPAQRRACAFVCLGIASLSLAFKSYRATAESETVREQLLLSLENVTARIRSAESDVVCQPSCETSGCFTEVIPASSAAPSRPKGYFTEVRDGCPCLCLSAKCEGRLVTVGVPTPEGFLTRSAVRMALFALAAILFVCTLGSLAPEAVAAAGSCLKTTFSFFWGLRSAETQGLVDQPKRSFWRKLTNPVVLICLVAYVLCFAGIMTLRTHEAKNIAKARLGTVTSGMVRDISGSVDNMLLAVAQAVVRHYRRPDAFKQKDADDLMHRYDVDEISIADAKGILNVTTCGSIGFDMGAHKETRAFNELLHGKKTLVQPFRASEADASALRKFAGAAFPDAPGYVQVGIDRSRLVNTLRYLFADNVSGKKIGKRGFSIWVVDETGEIVANGARGARADDTLASLGFNAAAAPEAGVPFKAVFCGRECLAVWRPYANLRLYAVLPCDEISCLGKLIWPGIMLTIVCAGFATLALRLSDLVAQLKTFILAEHERQKSDMTMARTIQTSALPVGFPKECDFRIFATMKAAREVGGDFYDFYALSNGRIAFLVADVSGKGIPAALFMMRAKATIRSAIVESDGDLANAVRQANVSLSENNDAEMFVTAWIAVYDRKSGDVEYVCAGHNPPLVKHADGAVEWICGRGGLVLAAMSGVPYHSHRIHLAPGDSLFLYTDGVTEAIDLAGEQYGEQRLETVIRHSGRKFVSEINDDLAAFTAGVEQFDDITMLVLDRLS